VIPNATDLQQFFDHFDAELATLSRRQICTLVDGSHELALAVAREIARRADRDRKAITVLDCEHTSRTQLRDGLVAALRDRMHERGIVLVCGIHALAPDDQALLYDLLDTLPACGCRPHVMASTAENLFGEVERGRFDPRLFYRLNAIHLAPLHDLQTQGTFGDAA
jgi:hypothetical protein